MFIEESNNNDILEKLRGRNDPKVLYFALKTITIMKSNRKEKESE